MADKPRGDGRKHKRIDVSFSVTYQVNAPSAVRVSVGNRELDAQACDLSEGGMAILTRHTDLYAIPTFTIVNIKFTLLNHAAEKAEDRYKSIEIKGDVRSSLFLKETKSYRLGIRFMDLSAEQSEFLANLVKMDSL